MFHKLFRSGFMDPPVPPDENIHFLLEVDFVVFTDDVTGVRTTQ